ncbi:MAG: hypothetical protein IPL78_31715 [Chloroflexi bacterium]|nr:hypothetical protein [Chloroflexota bacterium]
MKHRIRTLFLTLVPLCLLLILLQMQLSHTATASPSLADTPPDGTAIILNANHNQTARLTYENEAVFGPQCVTGNGDPFSPVNSVFRPPNYYTNPQYSSDYYSYRYRIDIPADYSYDVVRVELFDPDSYNHSPGLVDFDTTTYVISHSIPYGNPPTHTAQCLTYERYRYESCIFNTGESSSLNPLWFVRVDEIRTGNGSGTSCGAPQGNAYNNGHPTQTAFDLYYYGQTITNTTQMIPLANYMGRMDNAHDTDLRWVSPVGAQSYDQPMFVPANSGTFEVNLSTIPDIVVDPTSGTRSLYLDVTTLAGASENGFEIWAGPPVYTGAQGTISNGCFTNTPGQIAGVPSQVNKRNLHIVNCGSSSQQSAGVMVNALDYAPTNANTGSSGVVMPLTYLGPEYAGQSIYVTMFDSDAGSRPPVVFYFDTLAFNLLNPLPAPPANPVNASLTDYYRAFAVNNTLTVDPDLEPGQTRNCYPGNCQNYWVTPSYRIDIPTLSPDCVDMQTTPLLCTPFYGGTLMVRYNPGVHDTYAWHVDVPEVAPPNRALGCTDVFPVAVDYGTRSVTAAVYQTVLNSSQYPVTPPTYASLVAAGHTPNHPLSNQAQPGDAFLFQGQGTDFLNFGWLLWDSVNQPNTGATLADSLTWTGDSYLYHEPTDPTDTSFHQYDWVALNSSLDSGTAAANPLAGHIDRGRTLRLIVQRGAGPGGVQIEQMANFRVLAYRLDAAENERWLLLQFVNYVTSCGQLVPSQISFAAAPPITSENISSGVFSVTVQLAPAYGITVTTAYSSTDGTALAGQDYLPVQGVITFTAGMTQTVIPVPILNDTLAEGHEWFNLTLSNPVNGTLAGPNPAQIIIADDECLYSLYVMPGRIEAEDFTCGGEGVAYHDTTPPNNGNSTYRLLESVDVWDNAAASHTHYVGGTTAGSGWFTRSRSRQREHTICGSRPHLASLVAVSR